MTADPTAGKGIGAPGPERLTAEEVMAALDLSPHREGGYFRETYRSDINVATVHGKRSASTSCMYMLTETEPSRFHRLHSDELWFYHAGALAELVMLEPVDLAAPAKPGAAERVARASSHRAQQPVRLGARRMVGGRAGHSGRAGRLGSGPGTRAALDLRPALQPRVRLDPGELRGHTGLRVRRLRDGRPRGPHARLSRSPETSSWP